LAATDLPTSGTWAFAGTLSGALNLGTGSTAGSLVINNAGAYKVTIVDTAASASWTLNLPATAGGANNVLITDGAGNTSWTAISGLSNANASEIQSISISATAPIATQVLSYNGSTWIPNTIEPYRCVWARADYISNTIAMYVNGIGAADRWATSNASSTAAVAATATNRVMFAITSASTAGSTLGYGCNGSLGVVFTLGVLKRFKCRVGLSRATNIRYWIGLGTFSSSTLNGDEANWKSDTPNRNFVGFRFDSATDSGYIQRVAQTGSGSQTIHATSISADSNVHVFEFYYDGTYVQYFIDNVNVGTETGADVPATNVGMDVCITGDNLSTASAFTETFDYVAVFE
jgi:hypothetical protein